jgi:hypothetical protein
VTRLVTVCVVFAFLGSLALCIGCGGERPQSVSSSPATYRILDKTGSRLDSYETIYWSVLVPVGTDREGLERIAAQVVAEASRGRPFKRLYVSFYDFPELQGYRGPPLGCVRYAGNLGGRDPTAPGEYGEMTYEYRLSFRDWARRPSQDQVTWAVYRLALLRRAESRGGALSARQLDRQTGRHFGVTAADVTSAVRRVDAWTTNPGGRAW